VGAEGGYGLADVGLGDLIRFAVGGGALLGGLQFGEFFDNKFEDGGAFGVLFGELLENGDDLVQSVVTGGSPVECQEGFAVEQKVHFPCKAVELLDKFVDGCFGLLWFGCFALDNFVE
jgi:hypothetical protein